MSPTFSAINRAMNSTLTAIRTIKGAELGPEFAQAAADVHLLGAAIDDMNADIRNAAQEAALLESAIDDIGREPGISTQTGKLADFNAALQITQQGLNLIKAGINEIGELTALSDMQTQAETSLAVVLANQGAGLANYNRIISEASAMQNEITINSTAMTKGMAELASYIGDTDALIALMPTFADFAIGMNEGAPELGESAAVQYATALGKALDGQYEGLTKKGFAVTEAQKEIIDQGTEMERVAVITEIIGESWSGMANAIAETDAGQIVIMQNATDNLKTSIGEGLYPYVLQFQTLLTGALNPALELVANNMDVAVPIVVALASGIGILAATVGIYSLMQMAATKAALAFTVALLANPLTWVVIGIIAIVTAIAIWVNKVGGIEIAWVKATTGIMNGLSWLKQGAMQIFDAIVNDAINKVNALVNLLNKIPGVQLDAVANVTFGAETALAEEAKRQARTADSEIRIAEIQANQAENAESPIERLLNATEGIGKLFDDLTDGSGGGKSLRTSGEVKIDSEDIKMLLDISTMRFQANFQTLAPQVSVGDVTINDGADFDSFMGQLADTVEGARSSSLSFA